MGDNLSAQISDGASESTNHRERRRHPRYTLGNDALLYSQEHFAEILNISIGGMACRCLIESDGFSNEVNNVDLLDCNGGINVQGLKCRRVRKSAQKSGPDHDRYLTRDYFFEFMDLNETQEKELLQFILSCTSGSVGEVESHHLAR